MSRRVARTKITEQELAVLELRKAGWTFERIAQHLGYADRSGPWRAYDAAMTATIQEAADDVRRLELERIDSLFGAMYEVAVTKGSARHAEVCAGLMDRRAKLLGLDAPTRKVVNVITEDVIDAEIKKLEAELAANDAIAGG